MLDRVSVAPLPAPAAKACRIAHVAVSDDMAAVRSGWDALLDRTPASAYQTPAWIEPWLKTRGRSVQPLFGLGLDRDGVMLALVPLGIERRRGLRIARFLGGRDANTGLGLFDPALALDTAQVRRVLAEIARAARLDLFILANQPAAWAGVANPLLALPHAPSPSFQHEADLAPDPDIFLGRTLSRRTRKHIRQKEAKLAEAGPVRHLTAASAALAERIADALVSQRAARFGAGAEDAALRTFLVRASEPGHGSAAPIELHALTCNDEIVATFAGAAHARHLSGMLISFADNPHWARFSPGELLLSRVMARHCAAGTTTFDLGIGEARYKNSFCPRVVPQFDVVLGTSGRGRAAAAAWRALLAGKRRLKRSPFVWAVIVRLRGARPFRRSRPSGPQLPRDRDL